MKAGKQWGLVGAGGVNQSFVAGMPALLGRLGPVKGSSLRISRRIANGFSAGDAIARYRELQPCGCIWIMAPEDTLDRLTAEMAEEVRLRDKMVVVCGALGDSQRFSPLRSAGARIATLNCVPEADERVFVAEGHPAVLAMLRKDLASDGRKLIELRPGKKALYLSGIHLGAHLLTPWIAGAAESFRAAGFSRAEAIRLTQALGSNALRGYAMAGDRAWSHAGAEPLARTIDAGMDTIRTADPWLAALHGVSAELLRGLARKKISSAAAAKLSVKLVARKAS